MTKMALPFLGLDLKSDETNVTPGAVREARNVRIDRRGNFRRRRGWAVVDTGPDWRSLFAWQGRLIAQSGRQLFSLDPEGLSRELLGELGADDPVDFAIYNNDLYIVNSAALWRLVDGQLARAGVEPGSLPRVADAGAGQLTAGSYRVAVALVSPAGEESPAYDLGQHELSRGLVLEELEQRFGHRWRVYITPPDGNALYLTEEFDAVWPRYVVTLYPEGAPCETLNSSRLPGGHFVRGAGGRIYVARGDTLWFSDAFRPHLMSARHNFVRFVGNIRILLFVEGGAFVGDDRGVWWLPGSDPSAWAMTLASTAPAVSRSGVLVPSYKIGPLQSGAAQDCALWLSTEGHMVGTGGGSVHALNADRVYLRDGQVGKSTLVERDGGVHVYTLTSSRDSTGDARGAVDTKSRV